MTEPPAPTPVEGNAQAPHAAASELLATSRTAENKPESTQERPKEEHEQKAEELLTRRRSARLGSSASAVTPPVQAKKATRKRSVKNISTEGKEELQGEAEDLENGSAKKAKITGSDAPQTRGIILGTPMPMIMLKDEEGSEVDSAKDLVGEGQKGVVLFLVPKANTPGCTQQACGFRDHYTEISQLGFAVYCLSADSPSSQKNWKDKQTLPYGLLSDPKRELISLLTGEKSRTPRSHFVFVGNRLVHQQNPVKPKDSQKLVLEFISALQPGLGADVKMDNADGDGNAPDAADVVAANAAATVALEESKTNEKDTHANEALPIEMAAPVGSSADMSGESTGGGAASAEVAAPANEDVFVG